MKSKIEIYALAVCFFSVAGIAISCSIAGYSVLKIIKPDLTISSHEYKKFLSNESYLRDKNKYNAKDKHAADQPEESIEKQRLDELSVELKSEKREGLQSLAGCTIVILIFGLILYIHKKIAQKSCSI